MLLGVWAGYGIIDILFKQIAKSGTAFAGNLLVAFALAGVLMFACLFAKSVRWRVESVVGGILLGGLNFMNIVTYITAHQMMKDSPTLVFAGMNIGVIVLGTLSGALFFKEKSTQSIRQALYCHYAPLPACSIGQKLRHCSAYNPAD